MCICLKYNPAHIRKTLWQLINDKQIRNPLNNFWQFLHPENVVVSHHLLFDRSLIFLQLLCCQWTVHSNSISKRAGLAQGLQAVASNTEGSFYNTKLLNIYTNRFPWTSQDLSESPQYSGNTAQLGQTSQVWYKHNQLWFYPNQLC